MNISRLLFLMIILIFTFALHRFKILKNQQELTQDQINVFQQAKKGIIPNEQYQFDPKLQDKHGKTIEDYLLEKKKEVPQYWRIQEDYDNPKLYKYNKTKAMIMAEQGRIPYKEYWHKPEIQNRYGQTVAMYLAQQGIIPPQDWEHKPELQDMYGNTVDYYLLKVNQEVPEHWRLKDNYDNPKKYGYNNMTKAMMVVNQSKIPYKEYYHNPELQDNDGDTVAMILSKHGIVPPQQWIHDKMICNYKGETVQHLLRQNNLNIPDEWKYDDSDNKTMAMIQAQQGKIPDKQYQHQPELQDKYGKTVAIYLSQLGIIPNQQWQHDVNIKDKDGHTVCYYLFNNDISVPEQWQDQQYNNPQKINNQTNAMRNAINNKIPDNNDYHDPNIKDSSNHTVSYYLQQSNLPVPNRWYDESMKDKQKNTDFIEQTIYGQIPVKSDNIQSDYQNCQGWTVGMILARFNKEIPEEWKHDKLLRNINDDTIAMIYAKYGHIPPQQWNHQSDLYNKDGDTVAMLLAKNKIIPPREWLHHPTIQNLQGQTVGQILQGNNLPIPNEWYDQSMRDKQKNPEFINQLIYGEIPKKPEDIDAAYQDIDGWTVAMILAKQGKQIPQEWQHDKLLINNDENTVAMIYASQGIIPPKEWYHDKMLCNIDGETVQYLLYQNNIEIPKEWRFGNEYGQTDAMIQAINGIIPNEQYYYDPDTKDFNNNTVCYYLWNNGIQVPEQWQDKQYKNPSKTKQRWDFTEAMHQAYDEKKIPDKKYYHDPTIVSNSRWTVAMDLAYNGIIPPQQWKHKQELQNKNGWTVAMMLASSGVVPPKEWEHKPDLQEKDGSTVARLLASQGIIPPSQWEHDPSIKGYKGFTVAISLAHEGIIPPSQWYHKPEIATNDGWTVAMYLAFNKIIPPQEWQHNPNMIEQPNGNTVAMYLALNGIIPQQWEHRSDLQNKDGDTVAMRLAVNKLDIPEQWRHDKLLKNNKGQTVGILLSSQGIVPDEYWMHGIDIKDDYGNSIKSNLYNYNYIYQNGQFKFNIQTYIKQDQCCICLEDEEQEFIVTKCGHNVCLECFKELLNQKEQNNCPECRQQDWLVPIDNNQYQQYLDYINMEDDYYEDD